MQMARFIDDEEFKRWLNERSPYDRPEFEDNEASECTSCGDSLRASKYSMGVVCGHCLAYEFGVDSQERMLAEAAVDMVRTLIAADIDQAQRLIRQLLNDLNATLSGIS